MQTAHLPRLNRLGTYSIRLSLLEKKTDRTRRKKEKSLKKDSSVRLSGRVSLFPGWVRDGGAEENWGVYRRSSETLTDTIRIARRDLESPPQCRER